MGPRHKVLKLVTYKPVEGVLFSLIIVDVAIIITQLSLESTKECVLHYQNGTNPITRANGSTTARPEQTTAAAKRELLSITPTAPFDNNSTLNSTYDYWSRDLENAVRRHSLLLRAFTHFPHLSAGRSYALHESCHHIRFPTANFVHFLWPG